MKTKRKSWTDNCTADQKRHLKEHGIRTKADMVASRKAQIELVNQTQGADEACRTCRAIARAVGIES